MLSISNIRRTPSLGPSESYDCCLFASGYEARATAVAKEVAKASSRKVVWAFKDHLQAGHRVANDEYFRTLSADFVSLNANDDDAADRAARSLLSGGLPQSGGKILVDISSMTRCWYAAVIRALMGASSLSRLEVTFAYMPGAYRPPPETRSLNEIVGPVHGFAGLAFPDASSALLMGLGYEPGRAMGVLAEIDPTATLCLYADPGADERFIDDVMKANEDLARAVDPRTWGKYPLHDPFVTFHVLDAACNALGRQHQVVLTSNGPKLFGLLCFLVATRYRDVSVWRISSGEAGEPVDRASSGNLHALTTIWSTPMPHAHDRWEDPALESASEVLV
ncbi:MAG: hypothetical protein J4F34_08935 [Gemmatimonadetes bacterium]|nr:hypothetical protein [Gemmatimonadota bacterium]